ncbi:MAG: IS200/IS605 family transposase [Bacteroidota bacterium]|nr:IS200/IS605 family transposase [Bacteroidota bacterium]
MTNTYTQLFVQFVFTVNCESCFIKEEFREELERVICGIISEHKSKTYAIYCNPDHVHILVSINPSMSTSKLIEQIKSGSSKWLNNKKYLPTKFSWQDGYGAFSYSKSHTKNVVDYILNQPEHHKKQSFQEEYLLLLEKFEVEHNEKFLFKWFDKKQ